MSCFCDSPNHGRRQECHRYVSEDCGAGCSECCFESCYSDLFRSLSLWRVFAKIEEPTPLQVDIAPAVVVSWNSQGDKAYQIHSSTDLENWVVVVPSVQGTGERIMHFFIRSDSEIYYRVEERP
jgi:hypothetical protein